MMNYKWYLMVLGQYMTILKVSRSQGLKVIMGQYGAVLAGTWWYLVIVGCYWLVLGGTGSL